MIDASVLAADGLLKEHGIRYVVVGGQAVAKTVQTGTSDIDVMVTTSDFEQTVARMLKDSRLRMRGLREGVALFAIESARGVGFDILDSAPFAGERSGKEFFDYLIEQESSESEGIRYASTPIVWYTRLLATRWKIYAEKILVNILDGAESKLLDRVQEIAERFGTRSLLEERIRYVRQELSERGLMPRDRPGS
jgi:hypothetical protein